MNNKNVLYISYDGMTDNLGQSQVIPYLRGLSVEGFSITLLSFEKKERYVELKQTIISILNDSQIEWIPLSYTSYPPVFSTLWDIRKMYRAAKEKCRTKNIKIVHCRSYISALVGLRLKKKIGTKFIFDMRGFWADERVEGKIWNLKNPIFKTIYNYFKNKEILFLNNSDYTISLTKAGKEYLLNKNEISKTCKIEVIPCCADMEHFDYKRINEADKTNIRHTLGFSEKQEIYSYLGSIGTWYLLDEMLDLFANILELNENAALFFITSDNPDHIKAKAAEKNIPSESIKIKRAKRDEVPLFLSISFASIFFIKPSFSKTASSPTKMGEIMGMGIPLICNDNVGDVGQIMKTSNAGLLLVDFSQQTLYETAVQCSKLSLLSKESIREAGMYWYSLDEGVKRYKKVYQSVL